MSWPPGSPEALGPWGGFIGPGRGVDKGGGVLMQLGGITGVRFPVSLQSPRTSGIKVLSPSLTAVTLNPVSYLPPRLSDPEVRFPAGMTGVKSFRIPLPSPEVTFTGLVSTGAVSIRSIPECNSCDQDHQFLHLTNV